MKNWKYGIEIIGDILVIVFAILLMFHFVTWISGMTTWHEPDKLILGFEIAMTAIIGIIGIERLIDDARKQVS